MNTDEKLMMKLLFCSKLLLSNGHLHLFPNESGESDTEADKKKKNNGEFIKQTHTFMRK